MTVTQCHQIAFPHPKDDKSFKLKFKESRTVRFHFSQLNFLGYGDFEARGIVQITF